MKIDYEAHEVFNPDYLLKQLGFVAGFLELCEQAGEELGNYNASNLHWVLMDAIMRIRNILEQLREACKIEGN